MTVFALLRRRKRDFRRLCLCRDFATASDVGSDNRVRLVEVGPRDGLQNEANTVLVETKIKLIEKLAISGLTRIEAGSFVSPRWVPQMKDSSQILRHLLDSPSALRGPMRYSFLTPNAKGLDETLSVMASTVPWTPSSARRVEIAVFAAATETFSRHNLNCDMATSLARFRTVIQTAKQSGLGVRAYISVVMGCPFEGHAVDPHRVAAMATDLLEMGADEIALGDTTGMGTAPRTKALLECVGAAGVRNEDLAMHLHDTYGQALVNTAVALEHGIRTFDSSVGGLGGCPYSPGATGNVATENMVYFMESLGMDTGVDLDAVADVGAWITGELGRPHDSVVGKAVLGARERAGGKRQGRSC